MRRVELVRASVGASYGRAGRNETSLSLLLEVARSQAQTAVGSFQGPSGGFQGDGTARDWRPLNSPTCFTQPVALIGRNIPLTV